MNKKAMSVFTVFFFAIVFLICYIMFLGRLVADTGHRAVIDNGLTGIEAFFYDNLNIWIIIAFVIAIVGMMYIGGGSA